MENILSIVTIVLLVIAIILLLVLLFKGSSLNIDDLVDELNDQTQSTKDSLFNLINDHNSTVERTIRETNQTVSSSTLDMTKSLNDTVTQLKEGLSEIKVSQSNQALELSKSLNTTQDLFKQTISDIKLENTNNIGKINDTLKDNSEKTYQANMEQFKSLNTQQQEFVKNNSEFLTKMSTDQNIQLDNKFKDILDRNKSFETSITTTLTNSLTNLQKTNEEKLDNIQKNVNEKLDKSLNERLENSFKNVGEQLNKLYLSLGELDKLSQGVGDLNKTLSNVKTRGVFGELQLENILSQTLDHSQYLTNVATVPNSNDRVEFAVKIPSKVDDSYLLLPIDSKMPSDLYNKIVDAENQIDLTTAKKELEQRIKNEARTIKKYIHAGTTTDFAIMFLPTEGLYAEVLRINGLMDFCQKEGIIISGPTTITALLNSLRLGFANTALAKKGQEVMVLLQAVKAQLNTNAELIDKAVKKVSETMSNMEKLKQRNNIIQKKMKNITELDLSTSNSILELEEFKEDEEE